MSKIVGQEVLIKEINRIFQIFKNSQCRLRPHFILTGESGSGKSFTIKQLCEANKLDFLEVNAAQLTREGTSGNSLSKVLSPLLQVGNKPVVVFVDDLCDGGGTFLGELEVLKEKYPDGIFTLIVCHAVNEQGLRKVLDKFDKVVISNSYKDWDKIITSDKLIVEKVW